MLKITELIQPKKLEERKPGCLRTSSRSDQYNQGTTEKTIDRHCTGLSCPASTSLLQRVCFNDDKVLKNLLDYKLNVLVE